MVSREIVVLVGLVALQLVWTQLYPLLRSVVGEGTAPIPQAAPTLQAGPTPEAKPRQEPQGDVVRWLPALDASTPEPRESSPEEGSVLPVFPLGAVFHAPFSSGVQLKIFEPRYRQMYSDIMLRPSPRFVVTAVNPDTMQFAETGVIFHVDNLTDVSERTGDQLKYLASHTVVGRVRVRQLLNPSAWADGSTYLRANVWPVDDEPAGEDLSKLEAEVLASFEAVPGAQSIGLAATREGLWRLADVWINEYLPLSLGVLQTELQTQLRQLSPTEAAERAQELQAELDAAMSRVVSEQVLLGQFLLQSTSHKVRLEELLATFQPFV